MYICTLSNDFIIKSVKKRKNMCLYLNIFKKINFFCFSNEKTFSIPLVLFHTF